MRTDSTVAAYLEHMIDAFYDDQKTLRELSGYATDDELEGLYALGYNLFTYGRYEEAATVFGDLTAYAPYMPHYWRALGAVNQQLGEYAEAIAAYDMAVVQDDTDVVSRVYRSESQMLAGDLAEGLEGLAAVVDPGAVFANQVAWVARAHLLMDMLGDASADGQ